MNRGRAGGSLTGLAVAGLLALSSPSGARPGERALDGSPTLAPAGSPNGASGALAQPGAGDRSVLDERRMIERLDATPGLEEQEKTFEIAATIGRVYYAGARWGKASLYLGQAIELAAPLRPIARASRPPGTIPEDPACAIGRDTPMARVIEEAQERARRSRNEGALCAHQALEAVLPLELFRAQARFLAADLEAAEQGYDAVLELRSRNVDALYGRAAIRFERSLGDDSARAKTARLESARVDLERLLEGTPGSRHMDARSLLGRVRQALDAGGRRALASREGGAASSEAAPADGARPRAREAQNGAAGARSPSRGLPTLTEKQIRGIQSVERTPELAEGLAALVEEGEAHLAAHRYQEALGAYRQVVPFQPENGRAKAGMAWAMIGLGRGEMAERVWRVAVESDRAAVAALAASLEARGDAEGARALTERLSLNR